MRKSFLLIVEGEKTEKDIFESVLTRYGFQVDRREKINIKLDSISDYAEKEVLEDSEYSKIEMSDKADRVVIVQGSKNRIYELLDDYNKNKDSFEQLFKSFGEIFVGIFFIYDIDHTSNEALKEMFDKYQDETSGLLLVSSPCIEVLADTDRVEELCVSHLDEYKKIMNSIITPKTHNSVKNYIINHFEELIIHFINKNYKESKSSNILDHPQFVIEQINKYNDRSALDGSVIFRYFTTVIYVCIAYMKGLHKEFDNVQTVIEYFEQMKNKQIK